MATTTTAERLKDQIKLRRDECYEQCGLDPSEDRELDHWAIDATVDDLLKKGWSPRHVISYACSLEHVNPTLCEDVALARMKSLQELYT